MGMDISAFYACPRRGQLKLIVRTVSGAVRQPGRAGRSPSSILRQSNTKSNRDGRPNGDADLDDLHNPRLVPATFSGMAKARG